MKISFQYYVDLEIPPPLPAKRKRRPASKRYQKPYVCDGEIVCVLYFSDLILWNPSINKTILVPNHQREETVCETILGPIPIKQVPWLIFCYGYVLLK